MESGVTNNCESVSTEAETGTIGVIQNGDTFLLIDANGINAGRVNGAHYDCTQEYPVEEDDGGTVEQYISVTLSSGTTGSGAVNWVWTPDDDDDDEPCSGGCTVFITKSGATPTHDATGIWSYTTTNDWHNCDDAQSGDSGFVTVTQNQNGNTFRFTSDTGTHAGVVSGVTYICSTSYPEDEGTTTESIIFELSDNDSGAGYIKWIWTDGTYTCRGTDSLTIARTSTPNNPPYPPGLVSPGGSSAGLDSPAVSVGPVVSGCTPQLITGDFSDPDSGDTHLQTEWQMSGVSNFSSTVLSNISTSNLTSFNVPQFVLSEGTTYYWRARFYDNHSMASAWSGVSSFTTHTTNWDQNGNGIPDNYENETIDLNNDGTADFDQTDIIKSLNTKVDVTRQMGVSGVTEPWVTESGVTASGVSEIGYIDTIDPADISNISRPYLPFGLMPISLTIDRPTDEAGVTVYFSEPGGALRCVIVYVRPK